MIISTDYALGDTVYVMYQNRITRDTIDAIVIEQDDTREYRVEYHLQRCCMRCTYQTLFSDTTSLLRHLEITIDK